MKYRKKPVVIEAMHIGTESMLNVARWCGGRIQTSAKASDPSDIASWLEIPTLEGIMRAQKGDWVIRGVAGEFYPCKPDIFAATYELVEPAMSEPRVSAHRLSILVNAAMDLPDGHLSEFAALALDLDEAYERIAELEKALAMPRYCEIYAAYGYQCEPVAEATE